MKPNTYIADAQVRQKVFKADPLEWIFCTGGHSVSESETEEDDACHCMAEDADWLEEGPDNCWGQQQSATMNFVACDFLIGPSSLKLLEKASCQWEEAMILFTIDILKSKTYSSFHWDNKVQDQTDH